MERTQIHRGELSRSPINDVATPKIKTGITGGFRTAPEVFTPEPLESPGMQLPPTQPPYVPSPYPTDTGTAEPDWDKLRKELEEYERKGGDITSRYKSSESRILDRPEFDAGNGGNGGNGGGDGSPLFSEDTPLPGKIPLNQFTEAWTQEQGSEEGVGRGYSSGGGGSYSTGGGGDWQPEQAKAQEIPYNLLIYGLLGLGVLYLALKKGKK